MSLPEPSSIWPTDIALRQSVVWRHTINVLCPKCQGPALVGYLDGSVVAYGCHHCGPPPVDDKAARFGSPVGSG